MTGSLFYTAQKTSGINQRINELKKEVDESDGLIIAQSDDENVSRFCLDMIFIRTVYPSAQKNS